MSSEEKKAPEIFDLSDIDYADQMDMTVLSSGKPTSWKWTFAGPGHPMGISQRNRIAKDQLYEQKMQKQAAVNQKKWKAEDKTPDEQLAENVDYILERLIGWNAVLMGGQPLEFSRDTARKILSDPKKGALLQQCVEFLLEDANFTKASGKTSGGTRGDTSA
jgi:hypothetical protein